MYSEVKSFILQLIVKTRAKKDPFQEFGQTALVKICNAIRFVADFFLSELKLDLIILQPARVKRIQPQLSPVPTFLRYKHSKLV